MTSYFASFLGVQFNKNNSLKFIFFQNIKDTSAPIIGSILQNLGLVVTETTKDVTQLTAEGAKLGVDVAAGTVESGIDVIQGQLDIENPSQSQSRSLNNNSNNTINIIAHGKEDFSKIELDAIMTCLSTFKHKEIIPNITKHIYILYLHYSYIVYLNSTMLFPFSNELYNIFSSNIQ